MCVHVSRENFCQIQTATKITFHHLERRLRARFKPGSSVVRIVGPIILLKLGLLLSAIGLADEITKADANDSRSIFAENNLLLTHRTPMLRLQPPHTTPELQHFDLRTRPMFNIEFHDGGFLKQVRKLRNLSFITLAETGQSRLFLGVNDEGRVGLYIALIPNQDADRIVELARMPYLKESQSPGDSKRAENTSN
jgi:hypothetical protein